MQNKIPALVTIVLLFGMLTYFGYEPPAATIPEGQLCIYNLEDSDPIKVLFIGNSHTRFNDMPEMLRCLAASQGKAIEFEMVVRDGEQIKGHWERGDALSKIHSKNWDYVVLQERSTWALYPEDINDFYNMAPLFITEIKKIGATPLFFATYARQPNTTWYGSFQYVEDYEEMHETTTSEYDRASYKFDVKVVPVGEYWTKVLKKNKPQLLYENDGNHPTMYGSYVTALAFSKHIADVDFKSEIWMPRNLEEEKVRKILEYL